MNEILLKLSPIRRDFLTRNMELVTLKDNEILFREGETIDYVYFPITAVGGIYTTLSDGATALSSIVGKEGIIGIQYLLGNRETTDNCRVLHQGIAFKASILSVTREIYGSPDFKPVFLNVLSEYIRRLQVNLTCAVSHKLKARVAHFLLQMREHAGLKFKLTHDCIAELLGIRRAGVTEAFLQYGKVKAIKYYRGQIRILDEYELDRFCCECWRKRRDSNPQGNISPTLIFKTSALSSSATLP